PPAQFVDHRPYQRTLLLQRMDVAEQQVELQAADPHSQSESRSGSTPLSSSRRASGAAFSVPAGLTTTTVHFECRTTCSLTEPRTRPLKPPRPRRPTTTMSALSEASISRAAGRPCTAWHRISTSGNFSRVRRTSCSSWSSVALPKSSSGGMYPGLQLSGRGAVVSTHARTTVTLPPSPFVSRAAQVRALSEKSEPS